MTATKTSPMILSAMFNYLEKIRQDYRDYMARNAATGFGDKMTKQFCDSVRFEVGNKYIKVLQQGSVHSFIVLKDTGKFVRGDILMAASFTGPARNFKRGNILTGELSRVRWTGVS